MKEFQVFPVYKTCAEDEKADARIATGHSPNVIQYGGTHVWVHLAKIKVDFLATKWPVFIIVWHLFWDLCLQKIPLIMPSPLTVLWHYWEFLAGVNSRTNPLAIGIYSYNNALVAKQSNQSTFTLLPSKVLTLLLWGTGKYPQFHIHKDR